MNNPYLAMMNNPYNQITSSVIRVNGRNGAEALNLAPNSSIFVADETNPNRIWLCMTDGAGYKTVNPIICTPEKTEEKTVKDSLTAIEDRIKALEDSINEINSRSAKQRKRTTEDNGSD